jgi:hypothetical protein
MVKIPKTITIHELRTYHENEFIRLVAAYYVNRLQGIPTPYLETASQHAMILQGLSRYQASTVVTLNG